MFIGENDVQPDQDEDVHFVSERFGVYLPMPTGVTAEDNGLEGMDAAIYFYYNGVRVGSLMIAPGTASGILDDEDELNAFLEALVESSGADGIKSVIREKDTTEKAIQADLLFTELLVGGEHRFTVFNRFLDDETYGRGCYILTYVSAVPIDEDEASSVLFAYSYLAIVEP